MAQQVSGRQPRYKRILLKLSGEALMGSEEFGIDPKVLDRMALEVGQLVGIGVQVGLVIGGGNLFRGAALSAAGMDRVTGDHMGMLATVMNALAMRDALGSLHELAAGADPAQRLPGGERLLRLLAQYCQIEAATLHAADGRGFSAQPESRLGQLIDDGRLAGDDPLVQHALERNSLSHIGDSSSNHSSSDNPPTDTPDSSRYVIAAPLTTFNGERIGLLTVERIPFFALHEETLQTINLLLGYYTDGLSMHALAAPIVAQFPDCPPTFAFELQRLGHIHRQTQVPSIVVVLECLERAIALDLPQQIQRLKREMDEIWCLEAPQRTTLAVLMPLGDAATAEGYIARLQGWAAQQGHASLADAGVFPHVIALSSSAPETTVARIHGIAHA